MISKTPHSQIATALRSTAFHGAQVAKVEKLAEPVSAVENPTDEAMGGHGAALVNEGVGSGWGTPSAEVNSFEPYPFPWTVGMVSNMQGGLYSLEE